MENSRYIGCRVSIFLKASVFKGKNPTDTISKLSTLKSSDYHQIKKPKFFSNLQINFFLLFNFIYLKKCSKNRQSAHQSIL